MKPTDRLIYRLMQRDAVMVRDPARGPHAAALSFAIFGGVLTAAIVVRLAFSGGGLEVAAELVLAVLAGVSVTNGLRAKLAYRSGWLDGRMQMVSALAEAQRRNLPPAVWLEGELQRDQVVLGMPLTPVLPEDEEDR